MAKRYQQPQGVARIDWSNPITKGLALSALPSNGFRDAVTGEVYSTFGTAPVISVGKYGKSFDSTAAFGGLVLSQKTNIATAAQTHIILVDFLAVSGGYAGLLAIADSAGANASFTLQDRSSGTEFALWVDGATDHPIGLADNAPFGPSMIAISGDGSGIAAHKDGVQIYSLGGVSPTAQSSSRIVFFGERGANSGYASKGRIYFHASWTRRLSNAEIASISANPWQIYAPLQRSLILRSAAAGGTAATVIPIGISATGSVGSPTATGAAQALPPGVSAASAVGTPTATGSASIAATALPAGLSATASVGAPVAKGSAVASAAGVAITALVGVPVVSGAAVAVAAGVQATSAVGSPVAFGGTSIQATAIPAGVQALSYLGTVTASGAAIALPDVVQAIGAVGNLIATGEAWCYPAGVQSVGSVGVPMAGDFTNRLTRAEVVFVTQKLEAVIWPSSIQYEVISGRSIGVTAH